ncbi:MAG: gliding motility-associated C-terminal domain-containing protein, partial [Ferruginibacter sp.]|nr:gliding motility-associated C-terminal domain-containing protein [Ferruginibacter sp.]
ICMQSTITLKNLLVKQPWDIFQWSNGSAADQLVVQQPGLYWLQSANACGTVRDSILISPKDSCICKPFYAAADLGSNLQICDGDNIQLLNNLHQSGYLYRWQDGSTAPSIMVNKPGNYWVDVSSYCNTVRDTIIVTEKTNCNCQVYIPAAFTPNDDGFNDVFKPLCFCGITGELIVYNRYGNIVYRSTSLQTGWDGNFKNTRQPNGAYTYYLVYKVENNSRSFNEKGSFLLVR